MLKNDLVFSFLVFHTFDFQRVPALVRKTERDVKQSTTDPPCRPCAIAGLEIAPYVIRAPLF